jgi:hypothetical protein
MRRRLLAIPLTLLASVALATGVAAGGWAQIAITDPPVDPAAGAGTTIGFTVMQHGVTAVSWPRINVIASNSATGAAVVAAAHAEGPTGHYVATLTFPSEGSWALTFQSEDLVMEGSGTLTVAPAPATPATPTATPVDPAPIVGLAALLLLVVGGSALLIRGRRAGRRERGGATVSG